MTRYPILATGVIALLLALSAARAEDPDPYVLENADEALGTQDWEAAESGYREALEESPRHLPSRLGLARALLGAERTTEAIDELRRAVRWAEDEAELPKAWVKPLGKARQELAAVDPVSAELEDILRGAVKDLLKYAKIKRRKAATDAGRACRLAMCLDASCKQARTYLRELKIPPANTWVSINPNVATDWRNLGPPVWLPRSDGTLQCSAERKVYSCQTHTSYGGDFDMRAEIRIMNKNTPDYAVALVGAWRRDGEYMVWGIEGDWVFLQGCRGGDVPRRYRHHVPLDKFQMKLDPGEFNLFELRFRGDKLHAYINDTHILTTDRSPVFHEGRLGVLCAFGDAEFRRMEVRQP